MSDRGAEQGWPGVLPSERSEHARCLLEVSQLPTAAGREWRVSEYLRAWAAARPDVHVATDLAGNHVVQPRSPWSRRAGGAGAPVFITAHLDHPAFVIERIIGPGTVELAFRGGVADEYFESARVTIHRGHDAEDARARGGAGVGATITGSGAGVNGPDGARLFKTYIAELDDDEAPAELRPGDIATWELPAASIDAGGIVRTHACDDLSAVAAALCAFDSLTRIAGTGIAMEDVRLLFTRSEEIGFTGAIAACRLGTMPTGSRVIALENSRSFADSPIGGGPIVRVGDRLTIFTPSLTAACAKRAEDIAGHAAAPTATQKTAQTTAGWRWQRKLMAGGACEATVYCAYGYEATCICLPLGNYHNMANLQEVQDGTYDRARLGPPRVGPEYISLADYHGLIDLLVAIGIELPEVGPASVTDRMEKLYARHEFVLREGRS